MRPFNQGSIARDGYKLMPCMFLSPVSIGGHGAEFGDGAGASIREVQVGEISIACNRSRVWAPLL